MREILFRGKRIDNGEWTEGYYATQSNHACFASELKYQHFIYEDVCLDFNLGGLQKFEVDPDTIGQYTGLTDKNGKKIFEGDIIKHNNNSDNGFDIGKVYWDETRSQWRRTSIGNFHDSSFTYVMSRSCEYEIIGNIHDNPELLKGDGENA